MSPLHRLDPAVADRVVEWVRQRLSEPAPLGTVRSPADLRAVVATSSVTDAGLGLDEAWRRFSEVYAPATIGLASPRFLAFVPAAPSTAAVLMDAVVSAASFSAESWLEAAGAVAAENEVLEFLARRAGLPNGAGGCFVTGGSAGNLSALAVAREQRPGRTAIAVAESAHSSVLNAARLLGMEVVVVPGDERGRLTGDRLLAALGADDRIGVVVASAGSTNAGAVDDLAGVAAACRARQAWLHVDGAYGLAAMLVDELRPMFAGLEQADSFIVDPHKWLFAPLGSCALVYRDPALARAVHAQHAGYLEPLHLDGSWNPADHAFQLTRRAAGLPLWFALAVHGVEAHARAVTRGIELARRWVERAATTGGVVDVVMPPDLSVVLFRRSGWGEPEWLDWSRRLLADGVAFVTPTRWRGETVGRLVFLHPDTPDSLLDELLVSLTG